MPERPRPIPSARARAWSRSFRRRARRWRILAVWKRRFSRMASSWARTSRSAPHAAAAPGVVICHGFPTGPRGAAASAGTYPELADRIARESGWHALVVQLPGHGCVRRRLLHQRVARRHPGRCRLPRHRDDTQGVWLVGVAEGGTLAVLATAADPRVRGCAALAAPLTLREWGRDPAKLLEFAAPRGHGANARISAFGGIVEPGGLRGRRPGGGPADCAPADARVDRHLRRPGELRRSASARRRGAARAAECLLVGGAGHELRHDPRAIASLLGWLDRQVV